MLMTLRAIESADSNGTPLVSSVPRVRVSRAVSILATRSPTHFMERTRVSHLKRFSESAIIRRNHQISPPISRVISHQKFCSIEPAPSTTFVMNGRSPPNSSKIGVNCGIT